MLRDPGRANSRKVGGAGGGALPRMGDHRSPKRIMPGELENAG